MRRGLAKLAPPPSTFSGAAYSTFSGAGGFGRGRGSGASPSPPSPSPVPGEPSSDAADEDPFLSASSRGRGRGRVDGPQPSSPLMPSFPSFFTSSQGRGRGVTSTDPSPSPSENPDTAPKKPVFFSRYDQLPPKPAGDNPVPRKPDYTSFVSALGRGNPTPMPSATETGTKQADANRPIPNRAEATKRALEVLSQGRQGHGGAGRGGRGMQGRGRGRVQAEERDETEDRRKKFLGNEADVENLKKELGEEKMKVLDEAFEQAAMLALPSPIEDAYQDAVHTNNMVIFFYLLYFFFFFLGICLNIVGRVYVVEIKDGIYRFPQDAVWHWQVNSSTDCQRHATLHDALCRQLSA